MSDLGEISAELMAALDRLDQVFARFGELDRSRLAPIEAEAGRDPRLRQAVALIARARVLVRQAGSATGAARHAGKDWLARHGSADPGGSGSWEASEPAPTRVGRGDSFASAVAQAAWVEGTRVSGGMAYFSAMEAGMREATAALPPFSGEYTFVAHGSSERLYVDAGELTAVAVAELIRADEEWGGRPVRLLACNTGRGENPVAAELAKLLGVPVTAPDDFAWLGADGRFGVAPVKQTIVNGAVVEVPDCENKGRWRVFDPASVS